MPDDGSRIAATTPWPPQFLPFSQFDVVAINDLTSRLDTVSCLGLYTLFEQAVGTAQTEGRPSEAAVAHLLAGATSTMLRPSDRGAEWVPLNASGVTRYPMPSDLRGEQSRILAQLAPLLAHPGLRARLADIAWTNDRKLGAAAILAIESYCECAERLMDGRSVAHFAGMASHEALDYVERALLLGSMTRRRRIQPERTVSVLKKVYARSRDQLELGIFIKVAQLGLGYGLLEPAAVALDAEAVGVRPESGTYPFAAKEVLDLAAQLYDQQGNADSRRRCQIAAVQQTLLMRKQVSTPGAEAHWVQTALFALRHISGTGEWRRELRRELRDLQEDSLSEMGQISIPLDLGDERDAVLRSFDVMELTTALRELACLSRSQPIEKLRHDALQYRENHSVVAMMGTRYLDSDGKAAAQAPGASSSEEPDEDWFQATINRNESFRRHIIVVGRFEPARQSITGRFGIDERHLLPIVRHSPFVRPDQAELMSLGFTRLLQGDYRSAVHLLVPQLEPSLRYVLRLAGHDPCIEFDDMTEENVGLPALLDRFRPLLEKCIPPNVMLEIELLFHHRPGSALRHAVAHGLIGTGGCFSTDAIYACWLLYQLTCAPLLADWDKIIVPAIEKTSS